MYLFRGYSPEGPRKSITAANFSQSPEKIGKQKKSGALGKDVPNRAVKLFPKELPANLFAVKILSGGYFILIAS